MRIPMYQRPSVVLDHRLMLTQAKFILVDRDVDSWYPFTRQLLGSVRFLTGHRRDRAHARRVLDTLRERFDLRCGPLAS